MRSGGDLGRRSARPESANVSAEAIAAIPTQSARVKAARLPRPCYTGPSHRVSCCFQRRNALDNFQASDSLCSHAGRCSGVGVAVVHDDVDISAAIINALPVYQYRELVHYFGLLARRLDVASCGQPTSRATCLPHDDCRSPPRPHPFTSDSAPPHFRHCCCPFHL